MAVWDTDVKRNNTIADRSGLYALEFMANRSGAMETDYRPVEVGAPYKFTARVRASLIGANDTVEVTARWYNSAKTFLSAQNVFVSAPLPTVNTWFELAKVFNAPASAAFATIRVEKDDTTTAYIVYCDFASVRFYPVASSAFLSGTHSIASGSFTTVQFDSEKFDYGSVFNTGTFLFTAPADGVYTANALLPVSTDPADGGMWWIGRFLAGGTSLPFTIENKATGVILAGAVSSWEVSGSVTELLTRGQTIAVQINHNNTVNLIVAVTARFAVFRVE